MAFALSRSLKLPIEAMTETLAILAQKGKGKTYTAMKLAEQMHKAGGQIVVLDPVGNWWCLRLAADGKKRWSDIPIFGGLNGDFPLPADKGAFIADVLVDHHSSAVLDVSTMMEAEKKRFVADLAARLKYRKSRERDSVLHLFLEEAQEFIPQRPGPDETKMLGNLVRIAKLGRNWGMGLTMISQRPQAVSKEALNLASMLIVGCMLAKHDRKAIVEWIEEQGKSEEAKEHLAKMTKLETGEMIVWSPAWLDFLGIVKIAKKETYDASATPKLGSKRVKLSKPKAIDADKLREAMAETEEKQKSEDPKLLKKDLAHTKRLLKTANGHNEKLGLKHAAARDELEKLRKNPPAPAKPIPYLGKGDVAELDKHLDRLSHVRDHLLKLRNKVTGAKFDSGDLTNGKFPGYVYPDEPPAVVRTRAAPAKAKEKIAKKETFSVHDGKRAHEFTHKGDNGEIKLIGKSKLMLQHLVAQHPESYTKNQLAILVGMTAGTGGFNNYVGNLKKDDLITTGGELTATTRGVDFLGDDILNAPTTTEELLEMWMASPKIVGKAKDIIRLLVARHPDGLSKEEIADAVGMTAGTGGFNNYLGTLKKAGLTERDGAGLKAADTLFP